MTAIFQWKLRPSGTNNLTFKERKVQAMYIFVARYQNMNTRKEITRKIEFDGQFYVSELACYMHAMSKAYDMKKENECLGMVEFIAC